MKYINLLPTFVVKRKCIHVAKSIMMGNAHNKNQEVFKITGNWENQSKELKYKFSELTDEDLEVELGKENDMLKRVGNRLGKNRKDVINIIQARILS